MESCRAVERRRCSRQAAHPALTGEWLLLCIAASGCVQTRLRAAAGLSIKSLQNDNNDDDDDDDDEQG